MFVNKNIAKIYIQFKVKSDIYPQKKFIEKIEYLFVVDPLLFCVHQQKNIMRNFK